MEYIQPPRIDFVLNLEQMIDLSQGGVLVLGETAKTMVRLAGMKVPPRMFTRATGGVITISSEEVARLRAGEKLTAGDISLCFKDESYEQALRVVESRGSLCPYVVQRQEHEAAPDARVLTFSVTDIDILFEAVSRHGDAHPPVSQRCDQLKAYIATKR